MRPTFWHDLADHAVRVGTVVLTFAVGFALIGLARFSDWLATGGPDDAP